MLKILQNHLRLWFQASAVKLISAFL